MAAVLDRASELAFPEEAFEMANIRPDRSGLPFVVFISQRGGARHDVRVKVAPEPRPPQFQASVSVRPDVEVVAGALSGSDLAQVRAWVLLNREVLIQYWEGEIAYTEDALAALRPLPPE